MHKDLLEGITILDFSQRLPGPFAGHLLAGLGAKVIKIEDLNHKDAFIRGKLSEQDSCFPTWYKKINENKEIIRFDFNDTNAISEVDELLPKADAIILGIPQSIQEKLHLTKDFLKNKKLSIIELCASRSSKKALHDLNALAETGILSLHVNNSKEKRLSPPFVPMAGMAFGQKLALEITAGILKAKTTGKSVFNKCALDEVTQEIFSPIWPKEERELNRKTYLHNGLYPCYNIYQTEDKKYIALAAIEAKFWNNFCSLFNLDLTSEDRFSNDEKIFSKIEKEFSQRDQKEILNIANQLDCCLSLI
jgi:crotonobetainyl-CoA:carnitine CoA-transferase CaiB-like acyl-CoA transferase